MNYELKKTSLFGRICNASALSVRIYNPKHDFIALQMLILAAVALQMRLNF